MLPSEAFQVTDLSATVPCTAALNWFVSLVLDEAEPGEIVTELTTGGGEIVILAEADLLWSAVLVAVTMAVPGAAGAVYTPEDVMLPEEAFHVTDVAEVVPWTVAVKCWVLPLIREEEVGEIVTDVTVAAGVLTAERGTSMVTSNNSAETRFLGQEFIWIGSHFQLVVAC
jgi:hypothetical protein